MYTVPEYVNNEVGEIENCYMLMHRFLIWDEDEESVNNLKPIFFDNNGASYAKKMQESINSSRLNVQMGKSMMSMADSNVYVTKCFNMKQAWNMVVGLGAASVSETSMTLHHIYGIPYIPGQALKGIVRSYIICEYFDNDEDNAMKNDLFARMFGRSEMVDKDGTYYDSKQGEIIFFDALPVENGIMKCKVDIMNNHHKKYYEKDDLKYLNDSENPNPIRMLVIDRAEFTFRIAIKKKNNKGSEEFKNYLEEKADRVDTLLDLAVKYTKSALKYHGVGAKTAVGYGVFKDSTDNRR